MGTTYPPDGVSVGGGTWGTDIDYETNSSAPSGDGYIEFKATTPISDPFIFEEAKLPVEAGEVYGLHAGLYAASIGANDDLTVRISWFDNSKSFLSNSDVYAAAPLAAATTWGRYGGYASAPATAKYARWQIVKNNLAFVARVDRVDFRQVPIHFSAYATGTPSIGSGASTVVPLGSTVYNFGSHYATGTYKFTVPSDGLYSFAGGVTFTSPAAGGVAWAEIADDSGGAPVSFKRGPTNEFSGSYDVQCTVNLAGVYLTKGQTMALYLYHNTGSSEGLNVSASRTYFEGGRVE